MSMALLLLHIVRNMLRLSNSLDLFGLNISTYTKYTINHKQHSMVRYSITR